MGEREAKRLDKLAASAPTDFVEGIFRSAARTEREKSKKKPKKARRNPLSAPYDIRYVDIDSTFAHLGRIGFDLAWGARGIGNGHVVFAIDVGKKRSKIKCDSECMSKDFIKAVLCKMVDDAEIVG